MWKYEIEDDTSVTGIPIVRKAMKKNGSPDPVFETNDDRSYFQG